MGVQRDKDIIRTLVRAKIDVVEVGFLRNVNGYATDSTVCNYIEELNRLLPDNKGQSIFSAMAMSNSLVQVFIDKHLHRPTAIDDSLLGMGRTPGNLPIELIADYLNDYQDTSYDIDYLKSLEDVRKEQLQAA